MSITPKHTTPATTARWTLDPRHTTFRFDVPHMWGLGTVHGRFTSFDGEYVVGPDSSAIALTIDADSIDTGNTVRDRHLRSSEFFDVAEHPDVRFTSKGVAEEGAGRLRVTGELEVAGTSVPVALQAAVREIHGDLEIEAETTVDPFDFGMSHGPLWSIRPPATLHVSARLVHDAADAARAA